MSRAYKLLIDGRLVEGDSTLDVINPSTGQVAATVARASERQALEAVSAAKKAQPVWAAKPISERRAVLNRFIDAVEARADEITRILVQEQGKPLSDAAGEVGGAIYFMRYFAGLEVPVEVVQDDDALRIEVHYKALGVVAGISPWNFPVLIPAFKLAPAVIMGNSFILKPAPTTPMVAMILGEIAADIFPAGVVNVLVDNNDLGPVLTSHPDVAKVSFTGSTATGKRIMETAASTLKRLTLELGGNDAGIVLEDADIEATAAKVAGAAFSNAGQVCIALKRLYVHDSVYEPMCEALARESDAMVVGDGFEQGVTMGPMQNKAQYDKARQYLDIARRDGKIIAGGDAPEGLGLFVKPTVVRDISDGSPLVDEEQFAPILPVIRFDDLDSVIERVNASPYGLGGSVWTSDIERGTEIAHRIESGTVWINHASHFGPHVPFGGAKQSGIGSEFTIDGMLEFAQKSVISIAR